MSVFGPTDPVWAGPFLRTGAVLRAGVPCSPCYLRRLRDCPNDHVCMTDISAAALIEKMEALLNFT